MVEDLEKKIKHSYTMLKKIDNSKTRLAFYELATDLATVCLDSMTVASKTDKKLIASDYALYLLELIISKDFDVHDDIRWKFNWSNYFKLGLKKAMMESRHSYDPIITTEYVYKELLYKHTSLPRPKWEEPIERVKERLDFLSRAVYEQLLSFYTEADINKMWYLSASYLLFKDFPLSMLEVSNNATDDVYNFCVMLYCVARRVLRKKSVPVEKKHTIKEVEVALKKALKSTLFLASVANTDTFPLPILAALDIESFYRIVKVAGGRTIRIPTQQELDELLTHTTAMEKMLTENKPSKQAYAEVKKESCIDCGKDLSKTSFVAKVFNTLAEEEALTSPIIEAITDSLQLVNKLLKTVKVKNIKLSNNAAMQHYLSLNNLLNTTLLSLLNLKQEHDSRLKI
jgi:hypothetical protein